jgi:undecaprenyl-diphosphatase
MPSTERLPVLQAVALGLIQGPTELLPVSSSSHTALVPWLLDWRSARLDPETRRGFEVALHCAAAAALVLATGLGPKRARPGVGVVALATAPPAVTGYLLESFIDRRLGRPLPMAVGLVGGAALMAASDRAVDRGRTVADAGAVDGLLLGVAQSLALAPGVSRSGATLSVARARGFDRGAADALSADVGIPVIAGAGALKVARSLMRARPTEISRQLVAGFAASFLSTLASDRVMGPGRSSVRERALTPYAGYRVGLAWLVWRRLHGDRSRRATDIGQRSAPR